MSVWSKWRSFPDPRIGGVLAAPFGPGVYELRLRSSGELLLFGIGGHLALRMTSLLPAPHGRGTRNNGAKREFILANIADVEYRTLVCTSRSAAADVEREMKGKAGIYRFPT